MFDDFIGNIYFHIWLYRLDALGLLLIFVVQEFNLHFLNLFFLIGFKAMLVFVKSEDHWVIQISAISVCLTSIIQVAAKDQELFAPK